MKKYLGIAMVLVGIVSTVGCGKKSDSKPPEMKKAMTEESAPPATETGVAVPDDVAGDACTSYAEKYVACVRESFADEIRTITEASDGVSAQEVDRLMGMDQMRDNALERCEHLKVAGVDVLAAAIRACADSPCGNNGTNWDRCIMRKIAEHATTRKSASDPDTLAEILREACIAEDFAAMRAYMPSTDEVAQSFSGGNEPMLGPDYSDVFVLEEAHHKVACPCFAFLGNATPQPEMKGRRHSAQGDEVEDGVTALKDIDFARAKIRTDSPVLDGSSGPQACFLSFIMVNFGDGWKLLNLDT